MKIFKMSLIMLATVFTVLIVSCGKETIIIKEKVDDKVVKPDPVKPDPVKPDPVKPDPDVEPEEPVDKGNINDLQMVQFEETTEEEISRTDGTFMKKDTLIDVEYVETREPLYINPLKNPMVSNNDNIFPGSILRGKQFMTGNYTPLTQAGGFDNVRVSISLKGQASPARNVKPKQSYMRQFFNDVIGKAQKEDLKYVAGTYQFESSKISTMESFKKTMGCHIKANARVNIVKGHFNYDKTKRTKEFKKTNFYLISFTQKLFNASVDSQHHTKWAKSGINYKDLTYEPLYISSVDYGRMGYIMIESDEDSKFVNDMLKIDAALKVGKYFSASYKQKLIEIYKKSIADEKIKVFFNGGSAQYQGAVNDVQAFMAYLRKPKVEELIKTAVPISFKVRRLRDNTEVEVYDSYIQIKKIMKD